MPKMHKKEAVKEPEAKMSASHHKTAEKHKMAHKKEHHKKK